eukprot:GHVQ01011539.1.p1 GENE.GHVQ01011539.1~~GHVQ01011539.1.p1  ORF type:complete len:776 (-),score=123.08 GHVQ01011539.1:62-2230(-)
MGGDRRLAAPADNADGPLDNLDTFITAPADSTIIPEEDILVQRPTTAADHSSNEERDETVSSQSLAAITDRTNRGKNVCVERRTEAPWKYQWGAPVSDELLQRMRCLLTESRGAPLEGRMLKKKKEDFDVSQQLCHRRRSCDESLTTYADSRCEFEEKKQNLKQIALQNEKFIEETKLKHERAMKRIRDEEQGCGQADKSIASLEEELGTLNALYENQKRFVRRHHPYKAYLEKLCQSDDEDVDSVLNRYTVLSQGNAELHAHLSVVNAKLQACRDKVHDYVSERSNAVLLEMSKIGQIQTQLESCKTKNGQLKVDAQTRAELYSQQESNIGVAQAAIRQLFRRVVANARSEERRKRNELYVRSKYGREVELMLNVIQERVEELQQINFQCSLSCTSTTGEKGDGGRRRNEVNEQDEYAEEMRSVRQLFELPAARLARRVQQQVSGGGLDGMSSVKLTGGSRTTSARSIGGSPSRTEAIPHAKRERCITQDCLCEEVEFITAVNYSVGSPHCTTSDGHSAIRSNPSETPQSLQTVHKQTSQFTSPSPPPHARQSDTSSDACSDSSSSSASRDTTGVESLPNTITHNLTSTVPSHSQQNIITVDNGGTSRSSQSDQQHKQTLTDRNTDSAQIVTGVSASDATPTVRQTSQKTTRETNKETTRPPPLRDDRGIPNSAPPESNRSDKSTVSRMVPAASPKQSKLSDPGLPHDGVLCINSSHQLCT